MGNPTKPKTPAKEPGYPLRTGACAFGDHVLQKDGPDEPWKDSFGSYECPDAPNLEEGPMPHHRPGAPVLTKPAPTRLLTSSTQRHEYEPGDGRHAMHTDPLCNVCGLAKH